MGCRIPLTMKRLWSLRSASGVNDNRSGMNMDYYDLPSSSQNPDRAKSFGYSDVECLDKCLSAMLSVPIKCLSVNFTGNYT
ncbi:hypothetical protein Tco_0968192 [Tanacetum coccineum]